MLEPGRRHRQFPQAYFPFNSSLDITDLQDRKYLRHESFALCSLHAHLPIPYEVNYGEGHDDYVEDRVMTPKRSSSAKDASADYMSMPSVSGTMEKTTSHTTKPSETSKRPMFDMGIYERPNMLSIQGVEPGTFGMRTYLELPVADGLVPHGPEEHGVKDSDIGSESHGKDIDLEKMAAFEAFKVLAHDEGTAKIGKKAPMQDRVQIVKGGPKMWKRIGVRGITMRSITERLEQISALRDKVVEKGWRYTVLEEYGGEALGKQLFGDLLYPPDKIGAGNLSSEHGESDLKVQIEALVKVLTTPGPWLDFSLPAERLLFSQNLYTKAVKGEDIYGIMPEEKRRWSLIQLLLAVELVIRLDAALRKGVAIHSKDLHISNEEIHHFNKLRNLKVDWDLVVARRWLDCCYAKRMPAEADLSVEQEGGIERPEQQRKMSIFGKMKHSISFDKSANDVDNTTWDVAILPRQSKSMAQGLITFGQDIGWPSSNLDFIRDSLIKKLRNATEKEREEMLAKGVETLDHPHVPQHAMDKSTVELRAATEKTLGGPLSHAWLGGLVIPGYITCDLLMCTLLEHDKDAIENLGTVGYPRSGFVFGGRSYWSKTCVVAGVLGAVGGAKERMGWVGLPEKVGPIDEELNSMGDGWRVVVSKPPMKLRDGERIYDGDALSKESSPLGVGKGKVMASEFSMVDDRILDELGEKSDMKNVELMLSKKGKDESGVEEYGASVGFQVIKGSKGAGEDEEKQMRLNLKHHARFVGANPCRPPHGHVAMHSAEADDTAKQENTDKVLDEAKPDIDPTTTQRPHSPHHFHHAHLSHLPAHPLHSSYKYDTKSLTELLTLTEKDWLPFPPDKEASHVWIVDARGSWERQVVARAWCSSVGRDAVVSRVGRSCLGCAIRECRALEIGVLIRVG